jgi:hypothetical protein
VLARRFSVKGGDMFTYRSLSPPSLYLSVLSVTRILQKISHIRSTFDPPGDAEGLGHAQLRIDPCTRPATQAPRNLPKVQQVFTTISFTSSSNYATIKTSFGDDKIEMEMIVSAFVCVSSCCAVY